ncbi:MAG: TfoX/Sxy family protein [Chloroflexi bacterium]|nr:TfoX/Sxy family protein [Chloroflexota bacterium]
MLDALLLPLPGVTAGKMFGYPAYYVHRKLFACVYGDGVGVKVPEAMANELLTQKHIVPFQPMGRARMREWIQINRASSEDYEQDQEVFHRAAQFVGALKKAGRLKPPSPAPQKRKRPQT